MSYRSFNKNGMAEKNKIFAKNLKKYLKQNHETQEHLSKTTGFPTCTITCWVNGYSFPDYERIKVLADHFNCQMSDLIDDKVTECSELGILSDNEKILVEMYRGKNEAYTSVLNAMIADYKKDVKNEKVNLNDLKVVCVNGVWQNKPN